MQFKLTSEVTAIIFGDHCEGKKISRPTKETIVTDMQYPPMDVVVSGDTVSVWVDLPGMEKCDIDVYMNGDLLIIEGVKRSKYATGDGRVFLRVEREETYFRRILSTSDPVDINSVSAKLADGVLFISWKSIV